MESNKQERKNLVDDNPVAKEASALKNVNKGYGQEVKSPMAMMKSKKPSTAFAMKMSKTKSALPMSMPDSPMKKALVGNQDRLPQGLQDDIKTASDSPAKMYDKSPVKAKQGLGKEFSYKTKSGPKDTDAYKKSMEASTTVTRISKLASNFGTSKAKPKATIKSIRKDTRGKKREARRTTRDNNRNRRRDLRDDNRNEKDPTKRMANKVKAAKDSEQARKDMRAKKRDIRKEAKG